MEKKNSNDSLSKRKKSTKFSKRKVDFFHTDTPLTSKRVRIILSHNELGKKFAQAVRNEKHSGKESSFKVSNRDKKAIEGENS